MNKVLTSSLGSTDFQKLRKNLICHYFTQPLSFCLQQGHVPPVVRHPSQHAMLPMSEAEEAAIGLNTSRNPSNNATADHCPKHGGNGKSDGVIIDNIGNNKETSLDQPSSINPAPSGNNAPGPNGGGGSGGKKQDPKEIMKKRREKAICIDRVSRVIFPSTFILLNIIYWLVFSEILDAIKRTVGSDDGGH